MTGSFNSQKHALDVITHLRLDFSGCEYETSLDSEIKKEFSEYDIIPVIRGQKAPAAGVGLTVSLIITFALGTISGVTANIIYDAVKAAFIKIKKATSDALNKNCHLGRTTIETDKCDYVISACASAGVQSEDIDYSALIKEMMRLHDEEQDFGRAVIRIETPCEIEDSSERFSFKPSAEGSFSLWKVTYTGGERWPEQLYDAANECFIASVSGPIIATNEDIFYSYPRP